MVNDMSDQPNYTADKKSVWNSLELVKLLVSAATPVLVGFIGYIVWDKQQNVLSETRELQQRQARIFADEQKERESLRGLRLSIYREAAPLLNDILAYHFYVGRYREFSPSDIVEKKRRLDSLMYSHESLLTPDFFSLYKNFIDAAFKSPGQWSGEALLRSRISCRTVREDEDASQWNKRFTDEDNRKQICVAYRDLLSGVSDNLLLQTVSKAIRTSEEQKIKQCPPFYELGSCR